MLGRQVSSRHQTMARFRRSFVFQNYFCKGWILTVISLQLLLVQLLVKVTDKRLWWIETFEVICLWNSFFKTALVLEHSLRSSWTFRKVSWASLPNFLVLIILVSAVIVAKSGAHQSLSWYACLNWRERRESAHARQDKGKKEITRPVVSHTESARNQQ